MKEVPIAVTVCPHVTRAKVAHTFLERTRGLIGRTGLPPDCGLLIERCNAIHTCFMRFTIDAVFLDRHGDPVKTVRGIRPWRLLIWGGWRAVRVLETATRDEPKARDDG